MKIIFTIAIAILLSLNCAAQMEQFRTDSVLFELFYTSRAKGVKLNNIDIDTVNSVITVPVDPDLKLDKFDFRITPTAKVSFSRGKGNFNGSATIYSIFSLLHNWVAFTLTIITCYPKNEITPLVKPEQKTNFTHEGTFFIKLKSCCQRIR